jgi:hypothetical protein
MWRPLGFFFFGIALSLKESAPAKLIAFYGGVKS